MSKKMTIAAAVALVLGGGAVLMSRSAEEATSPLSLTAVAQEATPSSEAQLVPDMVLGKEDAPVTVVEYASYTCSHCANFHNNAWEKLKADYIDTGKVHFVYREVYFDKVGLWAAMVARCGGPEKFFPISDMIFETQRDWLEPGTEAGISDNLRKLGLKAGLDQATLDACMTDDAKARAMIATYDANRKTDGIEGTPTFLINGKKYSGEMPYAEFAKLIDDELN